MKADELAVEGALVFTPTIFPDDRGVFLTPYQRQAFLDAHGAPPFHVAQTNHSRSREGVVRGVHYTTVPPGTAKYVYCAVGRAIDVVVDIRVGSPTFGAVDAVLVSPERARAVYLPVGVGHAFIALAEDTVMSYMLTEPYVVDNEKALSVLDPDLDLPIPPDIEPIMSERDTVAPRLAEAAAAGLLPDYALCQEIERRVSMPTG